MNENILNILSGKTKVFGIIGYPVAHSFSPEIHNTIFSLTGEQSVYVPFRVSPEGLENAVKGAYELGIRGINVTLPHKIEVIKFLKDTDPTARAVGAVNTLKYTEEGYIGYNTDVIGAEYTFTLRNISLKNKTALLLGAGGAADAVCYSMLKNGVKKLYIANRTLKRAEELKERMSKIFGAEIITLPLERANTARDADIVLNTTTLGFEGREEYTPLEKEFFIENNVEICFDAIYSPWETRLLREAKDCGVQCINGFDMLIYQGAASSEIWHEKKYDRDFLNSLEKNLKKIYKEKKKGK